MEKFLGLDLQKEGVRVVIIDEAPSIEGSKITAIYEKVLAHNLANPDALIRIQSTGDPSQITAQKIPNTENPYNIGLTTTSPLTVVYRTSVAAIERVFAMFEDNGQDVTELQLQSNIADPATTSGELIGAYGGSKDKLKATLLNRDLNDGKTRAIVVNNDQAKAEWKEFSDKGVTVATYKDIQGLEFDEVYISLDKNLGTWEGLPFTDALAFNKAAFVSISRAKEFVFVSIPRIKVSQTVDTLISKKAADSADVFKVNKEDMRKLETFTQEALKTFLNVDLELTAESEETAEGKEIVEVSEETETETSPEGPQVVELSEITEEEEEAMEKETKPTKRKDDTDSVYQLLFPQQMHTEKTYGLPSKKFVKRYDDAFVIVVPGTNNNETATVVIKKFYGEGSTPNTYAVIGVLSDKELDSNHEIMKDIKTAKDNMEGAGLTTTTNVMGNTKQPFELAPGFTPVFTGKATSQALTYKYDKNDPVMSDSLVGETLATWAEDYYYGGTSRPSTPASSLGISHSPAGEVVIDWDKFSKHAEIKIYTKKELSNIETKFSLYPGIPYIAINHPAFKSTKGSTTVNTQLN